MSEEARLIKFSTGLLSENISYQLWLTSNPTAAELRRLIRKLQIDIKILEDEPARSPVTPADDTEGKEK